jgi:hypothetical protein
VIYILGTGYCGTTILGLSLGVHDKIVDLGELSYFLEELKSYNVEEIYQNRICGCGNKLIECDYWGEFYDLIKENINLSLKEKYILHLKYFKKKFPNKIYVDSSMRLDFFNQIQDFIDYPILITKDVRNWSVSVMKKHGGSVFKRFLGWYFRNKKFVSLDFGHLKIGYEEFALFPEEVLKLISRYLKIDFDKNMLFPNKSQTHSPWGNPGTKIDNRIKKVFYDYRWFHRYDVCLAFTLMPFVKKLNEELVYSNNLITNFNYKDEK